MGNTQASNAILAKARAMYGRRLTARNYQELLNCRDLPDLISYLKTRTSYSEALQAAGHHPPCPAGDAFAAQSV